MSAGSSRLEPQRNRKPTLVRDNVEGNFLKTTLQLSLPVADLCNFHTRVKTSEAGVLYNFLFLSLCTFSWFPAHEPSGTAILIFLRVHHILPGADPPSQIQNLLLCRPAKGPLFSQLRPQGSGSVSTVSTQFLIHEDCHLSHAHLLTKNSTYIILFWPPRNPEREALSPFHR